MAKLNLKSKQQILSSMLAEFLATTGLNDINAASVMLTFLEAAAREDFQQYVQMLNIIRNFNIDTTTGQDLDDKVFEAGLTRRLALQASGKIDISREAGFEKVATTFYAGLQSPVAGDVVLYVNDASNVLYGSSGTLIVGRGTTNEEEVAYASAPVDNTNYWTFTLSAPLSNDHGLEETVILKQGSDQLISAGTLIVVPASGVSPQINFTLDQDVTLLAGEVSVTDVEITATEAGTVGNIPIGAITGTSAFSSAPFAGARAENSSKFTTGRDRETDDELRDRFKDHIQSLSRGVKEAILNAIIGLVDTATAKRVVSANVVLPVTADDHVIIYIDDGRGFEPQFTSRGFELILAAATGGETRLQLDQDPLVKAQAETNVAEPFNMSSGTLPLTYSVGIQSETINFIPGDFEFPSAATAEEVVRAINNKAALIEARTSRVGERIVISAKGNVNEDLQVTGGSANTILQFPTDARFTLFLYKNDRLLSKDGTTAILDSGNQETYDFAGIGADPWPLNVVVDGKTANSQVVNFVSGDFVDDSAGTAEEVVAAINARLAGATASLINNDTAVRLASNIAGSSSSKLHVTGGSANTVLGFSTTEVVGRDKDYTLNPFLGIIELETPATALDKFSAATPFTRAFLRTASAEFYSITAGQTLVVDPDGAGNQTVTFAASGLYSASQVAALINAQLNGATASVRTIGGLNYLEITTNTYTEATGSIEIKSSSTASALNFTYDTVVSNQRPHKAFVECANSGPYTFVEGNTLVAVLDNDPVSKTYSIVMDFDGTISSATSQTVFANSAFNTVFQSDDELNDFYLVFKSGANTTTGTVTDVQDQGGGTWRYVFDALPANLADFAANDMVVFSSLTQIANNGTFLITAVDTSGTGYIEVTNANGVAETGASGSALLCQRRQVSDYTTATGEITVSSGFRATPSVSDTFILLPSTLANVVDFFNNTKVTTLSTRGFVEPSNGNSKLQITSKSQGSDGYVQVTGGTANTQFGFSTSLVRGLAGYIFYTGLLDLVHRTVYGDDRDLNSFPGIGAAGIDFEVKAPTVEEISIDLDVTLAEGVSLSNVEAEIKTAITGYINSLGVGADVIIEEIRARVIRISNVVDVALNTPTANIVIADREQARTRDSLITVG